MDSVITNLRDKGLNQDTLDEFLHKAHSALVEAFTASENDCDVAVAVKVGEAKAYMDFVMAYWKAANTPNSTK